MRMLFRVATTSPESSPTSGADCIVPPARIDWSCVLACVVSDVNKHKVLNSVVSAVMVDVVYVLFLAKCSAQMLLHNKTMFENVLASAGDLNIAIISDNAPCRSVDNPAASH